MVSLLWALQRRVPPPLLVEQDGRLIEALFQICFTVLQGFDTPLQQESALLKIGGSAPCRSGSRVHLESKLRRIFRRRTSRALLGQFTNASAQIFFSPFPFRALGLQHKRAFHLGIMRLDEAVELVGTAFDLDP